ncbi:MAG: Fic family protein [Polaribacter sp.]|jgi:Fic family protein
MLKAFEVTSTRTIEKINSIKILLDETILFTQEKEPKIYRKEFIELLFEQPFSKIEYVVAKLNAERKAASRYLKKMEKSRYIKISKIGRESVYVNTN